MPLFIGGCPYPTVSISFGEVGLRRGGEGVTCGVNGVGSSNFQRASVLAMEAGSGRGWWWFSSGIEIFGEDWAIKRAWGKNPRDLRCAGGCCPGIRVGMFWRGGFAQVRRR